MKHVIHLTALGVALVLGGVSIADAKQGGGMHRASFADLDVDNSGDLSQEELMAPRLARFTEADTDGDGSLSREELEANANKRAKKRAARMLKHLDANEDGSLSLEEMQAHPRAGKMFERADQDGNGTLSEEEFDAAKAHMRKSRGERRKKAEN